MHQNSFFLTFLFLLSLFFLSFFFFPTFIFNTISQWILLRFQTKVIVYFISNFNTVWFMAYQKHQTWLCIKCTLWKTLVINTYYVYTFNNAQTARWSILAYFNITMANCYCNKPLYSVYNIHSYILLFTLSLLVGCVY